MTLAYDIKSKTVNLGEISESIKGLSVSSGMNYIDLVKRTYKSSPKKYEIPVESGRAITKGLFKNVDVAVAMTYIDADTKLESHVHEEVEVIKIISGEMHIIVDNEEVKVYTTGELFITDAYKVHAAYWPIDSVILSITVPACPNWPEEGRDVTP